MKDYPKIIGVRTHGNPRPRLDRYGYTQKAGSPTTLQVMLDGGSIWRRVYVWQFSNASTTFIRTNKGSFIVVLP